MPNFCKFSGNKAFTEGWVLYSETLAKDMGLLGEPEDYFGYQDDEMLRASRVVIDTSINTKGWSRVQAIK